MGVLGKTAPNTASFPSSGRGSLERVAGHGVICCWGQARVFAHTRVVSQPPCSNTAAFRQQSQPWLPACEEVGRKKVNLGLKSQPVTSQGCCRPSGGSVSALNLPLDLLAYVNCS